MHWLRNESFVMHFDSDKVRFVPSTYLGIALDRKVIQNAAFHECHIVQGFFIGFIVHLYVCPCVHE